MVAIFPTEPSTDAFCLGFFTPAGIIAVNAATVDEAEQTVYQPAAAEIYLATEPEPETEPEKTPEPAREPEDEPESTPEPSKEPEDA